MPFHQLQYTRVLDASDDGLATRTVHLVEMSCQLHQKDLDVTLPLTLEDHKTVHHVQEDVGRQTLLDSLHVRFKVRQRLGGALL